MAKFGSKNGYIGLLGDANLYALSWLDPDYRHKDLAKTVTDFLDAESCKLFGKECTRCQKYNNSIHRSCLDHAIMPVIQGGGSSDHMTVNVTKFSREVRFQPKTIKNAAINILMLLFFLKMPFIIV